MSRSILFVGRFFKIFIAWWAIWICMQISVLYSFHFSLTICVLDSIVSGLLAAAGCLLVAYTMQYYLPQKETHWYVFSLSLFLSGFFILVARGLLSFVNEENIAYVSILKKTLLLRFVVMFLLIICMSVICLLWYTFQDQKEMNERQADMEKLRREAELFKLRSQLQPHFLFNSLNSISALTGTRPEEARKMTQQLSDFLRGTIKKEEHQLVTFAEELQHLELYLDIEKVRFGHRLSTDIQSTQDADQMKIPVLLLQPIVENAIKFGLYDTTETVIIQISAIKEREYLMVLVQNPFDPQTVAVQKGAGFGLSSIKRRLYLLFARTDLLQTKAEGSLFTTTLKIPQVI